MHYRTEILNPDGSVARRSPWKHNLVLDQGLNNVATDFWAAQTGNCAIGTGVPTLRRDSTPTTFTQAGTTLTASAGFFVSTDVGKIFKWGTGSAGAELRITGFTSATVVTVGTSATQSTPTIGTIWYVDTTGLVTETKRTNNCSLNAGDNQSTFSVDTWTHKRTFLFPVESGSVTYKEIGWSNQSAAGANLFGIDQISPGDSLSAGQQYKVIVSLTIKFSPTSPQAVADFGNNGFVTAGNAGFEGVDTSTIAPVTSNGGITATYADLEPCDKNSLSARGYLATATWTQSNLTGSTVALPGGSIAKTSRSSAAYTAGTFYRDFSNVWDTTVVATVFGIIIGASSIGFSDKFTASQTKDGTHTLTVVFRLSWGRILTN